jgi:hypothetical protein
LLSSVATTNISPLLDRKIEETGAALPRSYTELLRSVSEDNAATIVEYIAAMKSEVNLSDHYRRDLMEVLSRFSKYNDNKPFKSLTQTNIIGFLDTYRKTARQLQKTRYLLTSSLQVHRILEYKSFHTYFDLLRTDRHKQAPMIPSFEYLQNF